MPPVPQLPPELWQAIIDRANSKTATKLQLAVLPKGYGRHLNRPLGQGVNLGQPFRDSLNILKKSSNIRTKQAAARRIGRLVASGALPNDLFVNAFIKEAFKHLPRSEYEDLMRVLRSKQPATEWATNVANVNNLQYLHSHGLPIGGYMLGRNVNRYVDASYDENRLANASKRHKLISYRLEHGGIKWVNAAVAMHLMLQKDTWNTRDKGLVMELVKKGGHFGNDVLVEIARQGDLDLMRRVVAAGVKVRRDEGVAMYWAMDIGHEGMVRFLVQHGARPNGALVDAVALGHAEIVRFLLQRNWNPNEVKTTIHTHNWAPSRLRYDDSPFYRNTPLAAFMKHPDNSQILDMLLSAGADPNKRSYDSRLPPLHEAVKLGRNDLVMVFVRHGANVNLAADGGLTPLGMAIVTRRWDIARFLVQEGANVTVGSVRDGRTPLHLIASMPPSVRTQRNAYLNTTRMLLNRGADPSARDARGHTPVSLAAKHKASRNLHDMLLHARNAHSSKRRRVKP